MAGWDVEEIVFSSRSFSLISKLQTDGPGDKSSCYRTHKPELNGKREWGIIITITFSDLFILHGDCFACVYESMYRFHDYCKEKPGDELRIPGTGIMDSCGFRDPKPCGFRPKPVSSAEATSALNHRATFPA